MNHTLTFAGNDIIMNETVSEHEVINEHNWVAFLLLPIILFGVVGNILVCMAVTMEKRLQSVTNYFLLSLAITDLLVCIVVWPFSILHEFMGTYKLNVVIATSPCRFFFSVSSLVTKEK